MLKVLKEMGEGGGGALVSTFDDGQVKQPQVIECKPQEADCL